MGPKDFNPSYVGRRDDILNLVPKGASVVLDVGCSTGRLGWQVKRRERGKVFGIELDGEMARIASQRLDRVIAGDVEAIALEDHFAPGELDCIIFADVLEHLRDPWAVLHSMARLLKQDGVVVASIPNVRHYSTVVALVWGGFWPYRERGIHDRNHLRFFTLKDIKDMFQHAGLRITRVDRKYRIIERPHRWNSFSRYLAWPLLKDFLTFQYLVSADKDV